MISGRQITGRVLNGPINTLDLVNYGARFEAEQRNFFKPAKKFADRMPMHEHVISLCEGHAINYLEFGVWQGETFKKWIDLHRHPESRFVGFDSFEGLPEDWVKGQPKGTFSTGGQTPVINDNRGKFIVGWFQDTLYSFLRDFRSVERMVIHIDCDLYSSTLFVLAALDRHMPDNVIIIFDDFSSLRHEFAAWLDYRRSFNRIWEPVAVTTHVAQAVVSLARS